MTKCIKEVKSKLKKFPNSLHLLNYQAMAYSALKKDKKLLLVINRSKKRSITCGSLLQHGDYFKKEWKGRRSNR